MSRLIIITLAVILFTSSCETLNDKITFSGITETSSLGAVISSDPDDWKYYDNWLEQESSLFTLNMTNVCQYIAADFSIIAYPNPTSGFFMIHLQMPDLYTFSFRVVDKDFRVLVSNDGLTTDVMINLSEFNLSDNMVRVYYKFFGPDCEMRGHGDIELR